MLFEFFQIVVDDSVYVNTVIVAAFGCLLLLLNSFLLNILSHQILLCKCLATSVSQNLIIMDDTIADISYGVAFACIIGLYWSSEILVTLILTSFFIGLTNTTQNIIIAATVVMFPTSLRFAC